jgi:hypothetical protein
MLERYVMNTSVRRLLFGCSLLAIFCSSSALAQATLGEVLDAGGKQMSKDEIVVLISGNVIIGPALTGTGAINRVEFKTDGTYSGSGSSGGSNYGFFGTWAVEADGQACSVSGNGRTRGDKVCAYWFKALDQHFASLSNSDRSAAVFKRIRQ